MQGESCWGPSGESFPCSTTYYLEEQQTVYHQEGAPLRITFGQRGLQSIPPRCDWPAECTSRDFTTRLLGLGIELLYYISHLEFWFLFRTQSILLSGNFWTLVNLLWLSNMSWPQILLVNYLLYQLAGFHRQIHQWGIHQWFLYQLKAKKHTHDPLSRCISPCSWGPRSVTFLNNQHVVETVSFPLSPAQDTQEAEPFLYHILLLDYVLQTWS